MTYHYRSFYYLVLILIAASIVRSNCCSCLALSSAYLNVGRWQRSYCFTKLFMSRIGVLVEFNELILVGIGLVLLLEIVVVIIVKVFRGLGCWRHLGPQAVGQTLEPAIYFQILLSGNNVDLALNFNFVGLYFLMVKLDNFSYVFLVI